MAPSPLPRYRRPSPAQERDSFDSFEGPVTKWLYQCTGDTVYPACVRDIISARGNETNAINGMAIDHYFTTGRKDFLYTQYFYYVVFMILELRTCSMIYLFSQLLLLLC